MRPKLLTMRAFGPYGGTEVIDFTLLEDINMFLIHGPTGSGKTTILDAICYALYGQTNGGERTAESMRSKFATSDEPAEVNLVFTLKGEEYKVIRSPKYERPKKRGEGFTVEEGKALLYKKEDEEYKLLAARLQEVDRKIEELLVFNIDQFRQVIMIAQNKFRELLTADSKARQKILQDIFETGIYQSVEKKLEERSNKLNEQMKEKNIQYEIFMSQLKDIDHEILKSYVETKVLNNTPEVETILQELIEQYTKKLEANKVQEAQMKEALEKIQEELLIQNEKYTAFKELETLKVQLEAHIAKAETYKDYEEQVKQIEKVLAILPIEEEAKKYEATVTQTQEALCKLQLDQEGLKVKLEELVQEEASYEDKRPVIEEKRAKQLQLEGYLPKIESLEALQNTTIDKETEVKAITLRKKKVLEQIELEEKEMGQIEERLKGKEALHKVILESQVNLQQIDYILEYQLEKVRKQEERLALLSHYKVIGATIKELRAEEAAKQEEYDLYVEKWMSGQAGILAETLEEDKPCPVCGSLQHPKKALRLQDEISLDTIKKLESIKNQLLTQISKKEEEQNGILIRGKGIQEDIAQIDSKLKVYEEKMNVTLEEVTEVYKQNVEETLKRAQEEVSLLEKLEQQKVQYKERKEKGQVTLETLTESLHVCQVELEKSRSKLEEIKKEIPETLWSKETLLQSIRELKRVQEEFETSSKILHQNLQEAREKSSLCKGIIEEKQAYLIIQIDQLKQTSKAFEEALLKGGIEDVKEYEIIKQIVPKLEELKASITAYEQEAAILKSKQEMLNEKAKDFKEDSFEKVKDEASRLTEAKEQLQLISAELIRSTKLYNEVMVGIHRLYTESAAVAKQQHVVGTMTNMAKGKNGKGLSFERYIQSSIFDEVLESANQKLRPMTSSRYELYRTDDLRRKNAQAGLDIAVIDHYVGQTRPVNTLSGGESFMAALALALGLADVISRLVGASSLDTMFIDEGFGTLDEESLELAIKTLLGLQDTGRLVGIISHVKELREQIPARLEITSNNNGSTATFKL